MALPDRLGFLRIANNSLSRPSALIGYMVGKLSVQREPAVACWKSASIRHLICTSIGLFAWTPKPAIPDCVR